MNVESTLADTWVPLTLWFFAFVFFLSRARLVASAVCTVGVVASVALPMEWNVLPILLLPVALWLEAIAHDKIYARFLNPKRTP